MKIFSNISAFASIMGFLIPYFSITYNNSNNGTHTSTFQFICLGVFVIASIIVFYLEYKNSPKKFKDDRSIEKYMLNWISKTGRTVIFTRDMSWATSQNIKNKLLEKARANELILCMPDRTKFAVELEDVGAEIYEYSQLSYTPESRFTIVHYGRSDAKLAIGRTGIDGKHRIAEFENGVHPQFHLAEDMVNILKEINK